MHPVAPAAGGDGNAGLRRLSLAAASFVLRCALTAMFTLGADGPLAPADRAAIIAALLTGKAIRAGVFLGLPGQHFRHVDLAGDSGHLDERHNGSLPQEGSLLVSKRLC